MIFWTPEDQKKMSRGRLWFYYFIITNFTINLICNVPFVLTNRNNVDPTIFVQDLAFSFVGFSGALGPVIFIHHREKIMKVLNIVIKKNRQLMNGNHDSMKIRRMSNKIFLTMLGVWAIGSGCGSVAIIPFWMKYLDTGSIHFQNYFFQLKPYSLPSFISTFIHNWSITWITFVCSSLMVMAFEIYLRVSLYFHTMSEEIIQLRTGKTFVEEEEMKKLKSILAEYSVYQWFAEDLNTHLPDYHILALPGPFESLIT